MGTLVIDFETLVEKEYSCVRQGKIKPKKWALASSMRHANNIISKLSPSLHAEMAQPDLEIVKTLSRNHQILSLKVHNFCTPKFATKVLEI